MNKVKKVIAIILSFALVFGSMSALASAVNGDPTVTAAYEASTHEYKMKLTQRFFRLDDKGDADATNDEWVATTKVAPGEHVKVRLYYDSNFYVGVCVGTYLFSKLTLTAAFDSYSVTDGLIDLPYNTEPGTQASLYAGNPAITLGTAPAVDGDAGCEPLNYLIMDGVLTEEYFDTYGYVYLSSGMGPRNDVNCQIMDDTSWWYEMDFIVNENTAIDDEISVFLHPLGTANLDGYEETGWMQENALDVSRGGVEVRSGDAEAAWSAWDGDYYYDNAYASVGATLTFDAGAGGTLTGTAVNTGIVGTTLAALPTASSAEGEFLGWVPSTVENPTEADIVSAPLNYGYEDVTYTALYESGGAPVTVDVTFDANGGTFATWATSPYTITGATPGDAMTVDGVTRSGYNFLGWTTTVDDESTLVDPMASAYPAANTTYYALWTNEAAYKVNTYTMGLDGNYGVAEVENLTGIIDSSVNATPASVAEGFVLNGTDASRTATIEADGSTEINVYIDRQTYNVNYVLTRPGEEPDAPVPVTYLYGATVTPRADAAAITGYTFAGWVGEPATMGAANVTVTGSYTANDVAVNYSYSGDVPANPTALPANITNAHIGDAVVVPAAPAAVDGYTFNGWTVTGAGEAPYTVGTTAVTVVGNWSINNIGIYYSYSGDVPPNPTGLPADITDAHIGDTVDVPAAPAAVPGYTFIGWTVTGAGEAPYTIGTTNVSIVGAWEKSDISVTYSYATTPAGAPALPENAVAHIGDVINLTAPTLDGYDFEWTVTGAASQTATSFTVGSASITVVGTWTAKEYDITYSLTNPDNTTSTSTATYAYGAAVTAAPAPTIPAGYSFDGWVGEPATMPASDVTVTGSFTAIPRTITYSFETTPAGAAGLPAAITDAIIGDEVITTAIPTAPGYSFDIWTVTGANLVDGKYYVAESNVTVVGSWDAIPYTVNYEFEGFAPAGVEAPTDSTVYNIGQTVTYLAPENMDGVVGYTFNGWTATNAASSTETACVVGTNNILLTGTWSANAHTVTFDPNGGYFNGDDTDTEPLVLDVDFGGEIEAPDTPERLGYTFEGWALPGETNGRLDIDSTLEYDEDRVYTAIWTQVDYLLNYYWIDDADMASDVYGEDIVIHYGDVIAAADAPDVADLVTGYVPVDGTWYYDDMLTQPVTFPITVVDADIALYIACEPGTYDARFYAVDADNTYTTAEFEGGLAYVDVPVVFGDAITAPTEEIVAPEGYYFNGWNPAVLGSMIEEGKTFYATYAPYYTVTYSYNGDVPAGAVAPTAVTTAKPGDAVVLTTPTAVDGYTFNGWTVTGAGEAPYTVGTTAVTAVGNWSINDYSVIYSYDSTPEDATALPINITDANIGDVINLTVPTAPGYTFDGWTVTGAASQTEDDFTVGTSNITVVGSWTPNDYTITYSYATTPTGAAALPANVTDAHIGDVVNIPAAPAAVPGYSFGTWTVTGAASQTATTFTVGTDDITVVGNWVASGHTAYTIRTRTMDTTGLAYVDSTVTAYGTTGDTIVVAPTTVPNGFTYDAAASTAEDTATIGADGQTEVVVVLTRNQYPVKFGTAAAQQMYYQAAITAAEAPEAPTGYAFAGWVPAGTEDPTAADVIDFAAVTVPLGGVSYDAYFTANSYNATFNANGGQFADSETSKTVSTVFGETPVAPAAPTLQGYTFGGWTPALNVMDTVGGETYTATWNPATDTPYVVNTYTMGTDGEYGAAVPQNLTGTTGASVNATPASVAAGFVLNGDDASRTATIAADGSTIINVYIDRQSYAITTTVEGVEATYGFLYGEAITGIPDPTKTGYDFDGWDPALPTTMPAAAYATTATFSAVEVTYTINYYDMAIGGANTTITRTDSTNTAPADTEDFTITPAEVEGFTLNTAASTLTQDIAADGSTIFSVYYTRVQKNFTVQKANGESADVTSYYYGETVEAPAEPTRVGYTFTGWDEEVPATMPATDVTIVAQWSINKYDITYYVDNVLVNTVADQNYNTLLTLIAEPTKTGYTFSGWATDDATIAANQFRVPANDVRIDGTFDANSYDVTFNAGEGTFESNGLATLVVPVDFDATLAVPEQPVRAGYTFTGWVDAENAAVTLPMTMATADDITLTATWSAGTLNYTLNTYTMNLDGVTYAVETDSVAAESDSEIDLAGTAAVTAPAGFTFDAASSTITGTNDGSLTLNVYFTRNSYTLSVDNANGAANPDDAEYLYGATVVAPAEPTREGYTFTGWDNAVPATMPADDVTLTAQWDINSYTITYLVDGIQNGAVETYDFGEAITIRGEVTKQGHSWSRWDDEDAFPATMPAHPITLNAEFTVNSYEVSFNVDGVVVLGPTTTQFGTAIARPATDPTKDGFNFGGWYTEAVGGSIMPINMPAADTTYYAHWNTSDATPYAIEIYLQQLDGTFTTAPTISVPLVGTTGQHVQMTVNNYEGFSYDHGVLEGNITADGQFKLQAFYTRNSQTVTFSDIDSEGAEVVETFYYGEPIVVPEIADVTGKVFNGWSATIPATMGLTALTFTALWTETQYTVTYVVNGVTNTASFAYGDAVVIADPVVIGYNFNGWEPALPATMPANNIAVTAVLTGASYTATFVDQNNNVWSEFTVPYNTPIPLPENNPVWNNNNARRFVGWNLAEGALMPGQSITITPIFEDVEITLIPMAGSTTVIEYNDGANETNIIYGLPANGVPESVVPGGGNMTEEILRDCYLDYTGAGRIEITPAAINLGQELFGTGTKVELYNDITNELIETYYIVIFGDVSGDARIDVADSSAVTDEAAYLTNWSRVGSADYSYCQLRAANLNGGSITTTDASRIKYINNYLATVDQTTGVYSLL